MSIRGHMVLARESFSMDAMFDFPGRGVTGIQGPSGAGKTTLLRAIAGLEKVQRGQLVVNAATWQDNNTCVPVHRRRVGFVFQDARLFDHLDVQGNLDYAGRRGDGVDTQQLSQAIDLLGIGPLLKRRTQGLSGGEQKRVAIARALARGPALLLLDEPMAGLDRDRRDTLLPWLERLQRELEIPVLMVSHDTTEIDRLCDHLALMDAGRMTASGPIQAVLTDTGLATTRSPGAGSILAARVSGYDARWKLNMLDIAGGRLVLPGPALQTQSKVRIRIAARDVSITLQPPADSSILNCLRATVESLVDVGPGQVIARLACGADQVLARVTTRSVDALGLEPGAAVYIQVKSLALLN
ncbi:molybdenum ABC transporter ATP-binding protein [Marinihelvus fidelis]|uniref:Molybdenum ABC transporter ATP-binding protein n=1 Tax=Marinihelvus fidelis TaxID=2613842 RepID=A0A5N0TAD9_9GAMM|nr:molybdenum ABC transporter ATP-binding protein [Marinihelvus fidelis]KAA9131932.1 molybdenum ABC transporter ATP-binding protein [Marinihelvus fidelis]